MLTLDELSAAFARNIWIIKQQTEGLTQADTLLQAHGGNCLNWMIGHIAWYRDRMLELLDAPTIMGEAIARYKREGEPVLHDGPDVLPLQTLISKLEVSQQHLAAALSTRGEDYMQREWNTGDRVTTVGKRLFFLYFHESYHVGQAELFRQMAGHHDHII